MEKYRNIVNTMQQNNIQIDRAIDRTNAAEEAEEEEK